ncbi:MAG: Sporulation kinase A [Deltaproteobacteria bacterium ADurb.Bin510]|nr:MAG: Sporulation kinase A [Deltaproteobacteria bacterium ADurb.Bin510]
MPRNFEGEIVYNDITIFPLIANGIAGAVIRIDDVTERVKIEEMIVQSEKMLSVGGLAAGMAHEINNPLAGILQNIQVIRSRLSPDLPKNVRVADECGLSFESLNCYLENREIWSMIDAIMESGSRASKIVNNMLSFSRKSGSAFVAHDLRELMDQTIELAASDYDLKKRYDFKRINIVREYDDDLRPVECEAGQIQQVFLNILKNGAQAMAGLEQREPRFTIRLKQEAQSVRIEIEDNGPGMDEKTLKRIFEPFYTTKAVGAGTGLGLSVSYFIITENHGGSLTALSGPEQGTRFLIQLPEKRAGR